MRILKFNELKNLDDNLHLIPTNKPTRLFFFGSKLIFDKSKEEVEKTGQHIYI